MNRLLSRILKRQVPTKKSLHHVCNTTLIPTMDLLTWFPKKHLWISCRLLVSSHRKHVACTCRDTFLIQWSHSLERSLYSNLWKRLDWIHDSFISWQLSTNAAGWWWTRSTSCSNKVTCMSLSSSQLPNDNINCLLLERGSPSFYCCIVTAIQWDRPRHQVSVYMDVRGFASSVDK